VGGDGEGDLAEDDNARHEQPICYLQGCEKHDPLIAEAYATDFGEGMLAVAKAGVAGT
jgi:hypothetical protein